MHSPNPPYEQKNKERKLIGRLDRKCNSKHLLTIFGGEQLLRIIGNWELFDLLWMCVGHMDIVFRNNQRRFGHVLPHVCSLWKGIRVGQKNFSTLISESKGCQKNHILACGVLIGLEEVFLDLCSLWRTNKLQCSLCRRPQERMGHTIGSSNSSVISLIGSWRGHRISDGFFIFSYFSS